MKNKNAISGFMLKEKREIGELSCLLYEYEHELTGARLIYLDREDENKTFAIGFRTPPEDSTGVFHIIEHSVLCGSEKFPVKEPFVELLKSSLNTFLNALTYPDMTVYPIASRCERDFLNLAEVYLDAVFFPLMKTDKRIFMQEGVHLEYDKESDSLSFKGVVYNEMKGAYSAPEEAGFPELDAMLWEGTPYGYDSGGCPDNIPELTYEKFVSMHDKYYHPSNAIVVLDGKQDLDKSLSLIDSYFSRFDRKNIDFCKANFTKSIKPIKEVYYDATAEGAEESKTRLLVASAFAPATDKCARLAAAIVADILTGNNDSPLKRELISRGLAEDVNMNISDTELLSLTVEYRGIDRERLSEIEDTTRGVACRMIEEGVPREKIHAALNMLEFKSREADYGTRPRGVVLAISAIKNIVRGGDPDADMSVIPLYARARELADANYYEQILRGMLIDADHKASVLVLPSESFGREVAERERERLDEIRKALGEKEIEQLILDAESLRERQEGEDSEEALATIPRLELCDLPESVEFPKCERQEISGVQVLSPVVKTGGIIYTELQFDLSDLSPEELTTATILSGVYQSVPTENYSLLELTDEIRSSLGSLSVCTKKLTVSDGTGRALPMLAVNAAALAERFSEIPRLVTEVLFKSRLDDAERIKTMIKQTLMYAEEAFVSGGENLALDTASGSTHIAGAVEDSISGYSAYKRIKEFSKRLDKDAPSALAELLDMAKRILVRERLTVSVAGMDAEPLVEEILTSVPSGSIGAPFAHKVNEGKSIGYAIPSRVSYAVEGAFAPEARELLGALRVARHILSYEYLWNGIRVLGGAYGAGFVVRKSGEVLYYSYRDPSPERSLEYYANAPEALRAFANEADDLSDFIIGAVGEYDILLSPRTYASVATMYARMGWSEEDERRLWDDMRRTDREALLRVADLLDGMRDGAVQVVVGPESELIGIEGISEDIRHI